MKGKYKRIQTYCPCCDMSIVELGKKCPVCGKRFVKSKAKKPKIGEILKELDDGNR